MMRLILLIIGMAIGSQAFGNDIAKINQLKKEGEKAFKAGNYEEAAAKFSYLLDTLNLDDDQINMNLGHAYYQMGQKELAQSQYQKLVLSKDPALKSLAYQQLGAISNDPKTLQKALSYFKESIKSDPSNADARYNYELVKKKLKEQESQDKQDGEDGDENQENEDKEKKEDQENKDQKDQDKKDGEEQESDEEQDSENSEEQKDEEGEESKQDKEGKEGEDDEKQKEQEEGEEKSDEEKKQEEQEAKDQEGEEDKEGEKSQQQKTSEKLKEMNISEEKAKMILEALKNNEVQYIQQNRRRPTKKKDTDKPDW